LRAEQTQLFSMAEAPFRGEGKEISLLDYVKTKSMKRGKSNGQTGDKPEPNHPGREQWHGD